MRGATVAIALLVACAGDPPAARTPAVSVAPATFAVPARVGDLATDGAAFARFAAEVRAAVMRDERHPDRAVRKARWFVRAMLDALDDDWPQAIAALDEVAALEDTPAAKAMVGLTLRVWADAIARGGDDAAFRDALDARVATLPVDALRDELAMLRTMGRVFTPEVCAQLVDEEVGPHVRDGRVSIDHVHAIVFQRYAVVRLVPVGVAIDETLARRGITSHAP